MLLPLPVRIVTCERILHFTENVSAGFCVAVGQEVRIGLIAPLEPAMWCYRQIHSA